MLSRFDTAFTPLSFGHGRGTIISRYQLNQSRIQKSVYRFCPARLLLTRLRASLDFHTCLPLS